MYEKAALPCFFLGAPAVGQILEKGKEGNIGEVLWSPVIWGWQRPKSQLLQFEHKLENCKHIQARFYTTLNWEKAHRPHKMPFPFCSCFSALVGNQECRLQEACHSWTSYRKSQALTLKTSAFLPFGKRIKCFYGKGTFYHLPKLPFLQEDKPKALRSLNKYIKFVSMFLFQGYNIHSTTIPHIAVTIRLALMATHVLAN